MISQAKDDTFVKDLKVNDSVRYKGTMYLIDNIMAEGQSRVIRLISLTYPRRINSVNWCGVSTIQKSSIVTNIYKVVDYIDSFLFKTTDPNNPEWTMDDVQQAICINGLIHKMDVYIPVHTCFGSTFLGIIFTQKVVS